VGTVRSRTHASPRVSSRPTLG